MSARRLFCVPAYPETGMSVPTSAPRSPIAALLTASFVAASLFAAGPASADSDIAAPSSRDDARGSVENLQSAAGPASGVISGRLVFSTDANSSIRPVVDGEVLAYSLNEFSGEYVLQESTIEFDGDGDWSFESLPGGTYRFAYVQYGDPLPSRVWQGGSRFAEGAEVVELQDAVAVDFGTVIMPKRLIESRRLAGDDRFATNTALSRSQFADGADVPVVIVNGLNFPDALSAGPLATTFGATLLMVRPSSIPTATLAELERLDPTFFVIVGGTGAVSEAVEAQLASFASNPGDNVIRIEGPDRYATSRAVLSEGFAALQPEVVLLATGRDYPDALAATAAAGYSRGVVLLVNGAAAALDPASTTLLASINAPVFIVGGPGAVSAGIQTSVEGLGLFEDRLGGNNRFETSVEIAIRFFFYADSAFLANGFGFADALAAGPVAGERGAPIYLTAGSCVSDVVWNDLMELAANEVLSVGGEGVLGSDVVNIISCDGDTVPVVFPGIGETRAPAQG